MLRGYFLAHQNIEIVSRIDEIRSEEPTPRTPSCTRAWSGQRAGESLLAGIEGELYRFELELIDDGREWRMIGAKWERGTGGA